MLRNLLFKFKRNNRTFEKPDPANLEETLLAAQRLSMHNDNWDAVIVVVEHSSLLDATTGFYLQRRFNYYTYRGLGDYNKLTNLKAAYCNGRRVDVVPQYNGNKAAFSRA